MSTSKSILRSALRTAAAAVLICVLCLTQSITAFASPEYKSMEEMGGVRVGLLTGMPFEEMISEHIPDVGGFLYFNSFPDEILALKEKKIDAVFINNALVEFAAKNDDSLEMMKDHYFDSEFGFAFPKGDPRRDTWQAVIDRLRAEGRLDALWDKWTGKDTAAKVMPQQDWAGSAGTITIACADSFEPMSYCGENSEIMGFDAEIALTVAKELDLKVKFVPMEFGSLMPYVQSGKADLAIGDIVITEERSQSVDFANYCPAYFTMLIRGKASEPEFKAFSELGGKRIALVTGAPFEELIRSKVPDVGEFQYFSAMPDMKLALTSGKIDAYFMNNAVGELTANQNDDIALFPEILGEATYGIAFAKGDPAYAKWQAAFDSLDPAQISAAWDKWIGADESVKVLPEQDWAGANGTVKVAACDTLMPMSYVGENGKLMGFDEEILLMLAKELDVHLEFTGMEFSSLMPSVQSGKAQIAVGSIVVNDERRELVDFIEYYPAKYVLLVRSVESQQEAPAAADGLKESFIRTFVKENRWQMIVTGLLWTVLIAVVSGVLGTLLGFALVFARHRNNPVVNKLIAGYNSLIIGIPVVVILMVLYYIVFGSIDAPAVIVAVVGFTLIFASRAFGLIWNAVQAVDGGQREAALALGYPEKLAFRRVILPQAKEIYLPTLKTQFVMLLKETSVAGYITVLDLTKAGDLIRSRTLEAFFPLIAVAVIYFLLTWLLMKLLEGISKKMDQQKEARTIKGVD